jgi:uncharacterized protein YjiS (DUF1127 family)
MSTINETAALRPASAKRQVYSPLEAYWDEFREWCQREKLRVRLGRLTDYELADIGITRGEIDYVVSHGCRDPRSIIRSPE